MSSPSIKYALLISILFLSCTRNKKDQWVQLPNTSLKDNQIVNIEILQDKSFENEIISNGVIDAEQSANLSFNSGNIVQRIFFNNGDTIKQGTLIAKLDSELLWNEYQQAKVQFKTANNRLKEQKILFGQGNVHDDEMDSLVRENLYLRTGYAQSKNKLNYAEIMYRQSLLVAPFSGVIANISKKEGDLIGNSEVFCTLINYNRLEVTFKVLENEVNMLGVGKEILVSSFGLKEISSFGRIMQINPQVDDNGLVSVKARLNSPSSFLVGMNVRVQILLEEQGVLRVPKSAIVRRANQTVIFTLKNGLAKWNDVIISHENSTHYGIVKGLQIGDTIIISDNSNLSHNALVQTSLKDSIN